MVQTEFWGSDIETTGLNPLEDMILGIAFSWASGKAVHYDWPNEIPLELLRLPQCFHNGTFDVAFLRFNNVKEINYAHDTRWMQHVIAPAMPKDLNFLGSLYSPYPRWKEVDDKDTVSGTVSRKIALATDTLPRETVRNLCCRDADVTRMAARRLILEMKLEGVEDAYYKIMMPLANTCVDMRLKGVKIDLRALGEAYRETIVNLRHIEKFFHKAGWNPRSPIQMKQLLNQAGIKCKGTHRHILDALAKREEYMDNALLQALRQHRELDANRKVYKGYAKRHRNGRLHIDFDPSGTDTGRLATKNPSLTTNPRHRHIFIPDEGYGFMNADYSRLELRTIAIMADDERMIDDVYNKDFHKESRIRVYGKDDVTPHEKRRAKATVFGPIYGRGARSIAMEHGIPVAEAQRIMDAVLRPYGRFREWMDHVEYKARRDNKLQSPFKRQKHFFVGNIRGQAVNFFAQSPAADITLKALIEINREATPLLTQHDNILIQYPLGEERRHYEMLKDIMEKPYPEMRDFRFPIEVKVGMNWRDMEIYNGN